MRRANRRRTAVFSVLAIAWTGALFVLSMQTGTDSGALSAGVTERLLGWMIARGADASAADHVVRKCAHFAGFALSGFFTGMALFSVRGTRRTLIASIGLEAVIAVLNELSQLIPDGRACSARDMLIDFAGAAIGVLIAWALNRRREHKERQGVEL